jgi:hypothetical protein
MSAEDCFNAKIAIGRVGKAAGERIKAMIADAKQRYNTGDAAGARQAMDEALRAVKFEAVAREARTLGNVEAQLALKNDFAKFRGQFDALRESGANMGVIPGLTQYQGKASELGLFAQSKVYGLGLIDQGNQWNNVYYLARQLRGEAHAKFRDAVAALRPTLAGLKRDHDLENAALDAIYGKTSSPEAAAIAKAWGEASEFGRQEFNRGAGYEAIPLRKDWGLPNPSMDQAKVLSYGPEAFIDRVTPLLDRAKMIDFDTGLPMSDAKLRFVLRDVWDTGRAAGAEGPASAGFVGEGPLSGRRSNPRTLVFKDGDAWRTFNELFGTGAGPFETMVGHLQQVTHDAAMMRVFGPDPEAAKRLLLQMFDRETERLGVQGKEGDSKSMAEALKANKATASSVGGQRGKFLDAWSNMTGETGLAVNTSFATWMGDLRSFLGAAQLGTSIISAVSDVALASSAARMNGLPVAGVMRQIAALFAERGAEINAAQHGLLLDSLAHGAREADMFMGETIKSAVASKLSTAVLRSIGHRIWTAKIRDGFALEFMAKMAAAMENKTPFADLSFRKSLEKYGVDEAAWGAIADKVALHEPRPGATLLRPMDVRATPGLEAAGESLGRMVQNELNYTALEGDPLTRRIAMGSSRPGTVGGEFRRSIALYRSWPVTTFNLMLNRHFAPGWDGTRLAHGAATFVSMVLLGMAARQAKQIVAGRDPISMDPNTKEGLLNWGAAVVQGGGLGVFGDMLAADKSRREDTWASMAAGPVADMAERVGGQFLLRNLQAAAEGKPTNWAGEGFWVAANYLPGSNVFWLKLAFQCAGVDQLGLMVDPKAPERFARIEAAAKKNYGQSYWWHRGQTAPERGPDFSAAIGR